MSADNDVFIVGMGRTAFTRDPSHSVRDLAREATLSALRDAGLTPADLSAAFFANAGQGALEGQYMVRGQIALRHAGIQNIPIINVESACASASAALKLAITAVRAGEAEAVLAVGAERLATGDGERSKAFFRGAVDVNNPTPRLSELTGIAADALDAPSDRSIFMDLYAGFAREHMRTYGTTREQLAAVTSKNRTHASHNLNAQLRERLTPEQVMGAREIVWPLTLPMCAPIGNGAAAAIVCGRDYLRRLPGARPVRIAAFCLGSGTDRDPNDQGTYITHRLARRAYEIAGVGAADISLAEVHDATAIGEILQSEHLGLVPYGEGGPAAAAGITSLGGRLPINVSGGLECNGHPVGATGLAQVHELVIHLRGEAGARQVENARFGMLENAGGFVGVEDSSACVAIFEKFSA